MNLLIKTISLSALALLMLACGQTTPQQEAVDTLIDRIDSLSAALDKVDVETLTANYKKAGELNKVLSPEFSNFSKTSLKTYVDLSNLEKGHRKADLDFENFRKEIDYSLQQALILKRDVANGTITATDAEKYIADENTVLNKLIKSFAFKPEKSKDFLERYEVLIPKAQHLVDSINQTKK